MKTKEFLISFSLFLGVAFLFFNPFFFKGYLPFPGDLLVGHYAPWNSSSYLGFAPGGVPHKAQGIDVVRMLFPWKHFSTQMFKNEQISLWNPYNFSGNPHLANFQTGVFYPLSFIFLILPFNSAWTVFIILQPLLACIFTYLFLRKIKLSWQAAFLASLAFAYCLYLTVWLEWGNLGHAILWLPLALFLIEKLILKIRLKWLLLFIFSLTSSILAGYIQVTFYLFGVVYAYFFFRLFSSVKKEKLVKTIAVGASGLVAVFLSAAQLLPTWEIFQQSAREAYPYEKIPQLLLPWFGLVATFVPDFFGNPASRNYWLPGTYIERVTYLGVLPLFFAFWAIFRRRKARPPAGGEKIIQFFLVLAVAVLVLTLNLFPTRLFYGLKIPIISTTVPTRLLYILAFALAVLASFGIDDYLKNKNQKIKVASLLFFGFYLFLWLFVLLAPKIFAPPAGGWVANLQVTQHNLILPTVFAFLGMFLIVFSTRWSKKSLIFWGIVLVTIFDLFFYFKKITPFSPPEFVYPETDIMGFLKEKAGINRFWGYGTGYIESNFSTLLKNYSVEGYDPLFIRRYGELISTSEDGQIKKPVPRADVNLVKGYGQQALRENLYRQRLLNLLGVKYLFQKNETLSEEWQPDYQTFPSEIYQLIWQKGSWQVYENQTALPRIFLVNRYRVETEKQKIVNLIFDPEFKLGEEIILEEKLPEDFQLTDQATGKIELLDYQPNRLVIKTTALGNNFLFISDNYFPGWQVKIDGISQKIYRADYTFRAVPVPEGEHQVIFSYEPQFFKLGMKISGGTLLMILLFALGTKVLGFRKKV